MVGSAFHKYQVFSEARLSSLDRVSVVGKEKQFFLLMVGLG